MSIVIIHTKLKTKTKTKKKLKTNAIEKETVIDPGKIRKKKIKKEKSKEKFVLNVTLACRHKTHSRAAMDL